MTLARAAFRGLVVAQLQAANTAAGQSVYENRALPLATSMLPAIVVQTPMDMKRSLLRGGPQFNSTFLLELTLRVTGRTDDAALLALETLIGQVEAATISNQVLINAVQEFSSVRTEQKVGVDSAVIVAEATMHIECDIYEDYRFPPSAPLTDILANVTDPTGTIPLVEFDAALPQ